MTIPIYQCEEWQCRHVFTDKRCCALPKGHEGLHMPRSENEPSEILAWLNIEQKRAEHWFRSASGVNRFALTMPELMRIRHALEIAATRAAGRTGPPLDLWQPIETVPDTHDYLLLMSPAHGRIIGGHVGGDAWHLVGVGVVTSASERPTHWMPLPAVPQGGGHPTEGEVND